MSLATDQRLIQYVGNGATVDFAIPFVFHDTDHIIAYTEIISTGVQTQLTEGADYSLAGLSNPAGGTLTTVATYDNDTRLTIYRQVPNEQPTDYVNNDNFEAEAHERQMDLIVMMIQQLAESGANGSGIPSGLAIRFPITEPSNYTTVLPNASDRKAKVITFDDNTGEMILLDRTEFEGPQGVQGVQGIQGVQGDPGADGIVPPGVAAGNIAYYDGADWQVLAPPPADSNKYVLSMTDGVPEWLATTGCP